MVSASKYGRIAAGDLDSPLLLPLLLLAAAASAAAAVAAAATLAAGCAAAALGNSYTSPVRDL